MNKKQFLAAGGGVVLVLAAGTGLSVAQTTSTSSQPPSATTTMDAGQHAATHEGMRAQMPEDLRAQCHAMHQQMGTTGTGMMHQGGMGPGRTVGSTPAS